MSKAYLFYANQLHTELEFHLNSLGGVAHHIYHQLGGEIYNGGYLYLPSENHRWLRADLTPVLLEDVPKELRLLVLLMEK